MKNHAISTGVLVLGALLLTTLAAPSSALAADAPTLKPVCGTAGDPVLLSGSSFADSPTVEFDGVEARVLRSGGEKILCIVPENTSLGSVKVTVDGTLTAQEFTVLKDGSPVVYRMSAETVTAGTRVFLIGRRLHGGSAEFLDSGGTSQAKADLRGGRRAAMFEVPSGLSAGTYTLKITNKDGLDTGSCSPEIAVVSAGTPALDSITPSGQLPGQRIRIDGSDLSPGGFVQVEWKDSSGSVLKALGFGNGYDLIKSNVPFRAKHGETYEVSVKLRGVETAVGPIEYEVGTPGAPVINKIDPVKGPAGSFFKIFGENFLVFGEKPKVEMSDGTDTIEARIVSLFPGLKDRDEVLVVSVPKDAADGKYEVVVKVGTSSSDAKTFEVGSRALSVDGMKPDFQPARGPWGPVFITGAGFGTKDGKDIEVTWDDGSGGRPLSGKIMWRTDQRLVVFPPGGWSKPLAKGSYTVKVTLDPSGAGTTVTAGTYTVR